MDIEGVVSKILPPVSGSGARGPWTRQDVIFDLPGEFSRKLCVSFWNDRAQEAANLKEGDAYLISANIESRERNERWYTEVRAWKIARKGDSQGYGADPYAGAGAGGDAAASYARSFGAPVPPAEAPAIEQPPLDQVDDLPF